MHHEISPSLYLRAAVLMINAHWLGCYSAEERQGERKTHEIYPWGHFSLLLLSLLVLTAVSILLENAWSIGKGKGTTFKSRFQSKDKDRNRHFFTKENWPRWGFVIVVVYFCLLVYYMCCFHFKANCNRGFHLCPPCPPCIYFSCVLLSLLSLCLQESIWYNLCKCYSWPLMRRTGQNNSVALLQS